MVVCKPLPNMGYTGHNYNPTINMEKVGHDMMMMGEPSVTSSINGLDGGGMGFDTYGSNVCM